MGVRRWSEEVELSWWVRGGRKQLEKPGNEVDILGYSNTSICTLGIWKNWMDSVLHNSVT